MEQEKSSLLKICNAEICEKIRTLGVATDFIIVADQTIFQAHKPIFGACSNYLFELFLKTPSGPAMYILENVASRDMENLLIFVYEGKIQVKTTEVVGLLNAAKQLKIDSLIKELTKSRKEMETIASSTPATIETINGISNISRKQSILNETVNYSDITPQPSKFSLEAVIAENLGLNDTKPHDELPDFVFKSPSTINPVSIPGPVASEISCKQNQSIVIPTANDADNHHTPVATHTDIATTVTVKRGRCKYPRIPTPFPAVSKPPSETVRENQKEFLLSQPPQSPKQIQLKSKFPRKSAKQMRYTFGDPLLCSSNICQEIPAISEERLEKVKPDLVKEGLLIETYLDEMQEGSGIIQRVLDTNTMSSSEDSLSLNLRRNKLPMAKRRRIPASTRPEIMSSTFSSDEPPPRPPRRKVKRKPRVEFEEQW